jgi:anti-sigma B factor antagonist
MQEERISTQQHREGKYPVVEVTGEIDVYTSPVFKGAIYDPILQGFRHVIVDMSRVTYMDSSGFGILLGACKQVKPKGGTISLVGCNDMITRMLNITRLSTIFNLTQSLDEAVQSIEDAEQP